MVIKCIMHTDKYPKLRAHLRTLTVPQQSAFAKECGTTLGYLRKFLSKGGRMDVSTVSRLVEHSRGGIPASELRYDVNWSVFEKHRRPKTPKIRKPLAPASTAIEAEAS
jgi:hypothetical protein